METYGANKDNTTIMQCTLQAKLGTRDLEASVFKIVEVFEKDKIDFEAKFAMLQEAVSEYLELTVMDLFCSLVDC